MKKYMAMRIWQPTMKWFPVDFANLLQKLCHKLDYFVHSSSVILATTNNANNANNAIYIPSSMSTNNQQDNFVHSNEWKMDYK